MLFTNYLKSIESDLNYNIDNCDLSNYFKCNSNIHFNPELYNDIDMLSNLKVIDKTYTKFGYYYLKNKLFNPTNDHQQLLQNKKNNMLLNNHKNYKWISSKLKDIQSIQHSIIHLFDTEFIKNKHIEAIYFKDYFDRFNNNEVVLNYYNLFNIYYPLYHIFSPIILLIIPFIFKKIFPDFSFKNNIVFLFAGIPNMDMFQIKDFKQLIMTSITILFFLYNSYISIKQSQHTTLINKVIKTHLININKIIELSKKIYEFENLGSNLKFSKFSDNLGLISELNTVEKLNNNGKNMVLYKKIIQNKAELLPYIKFIALNDYIININTLLNNGYSMPTYIQGESKLTIIDMKHPYINNCVTNSIDIGNNDKSKNIIITGPNASGKSTILKTILFNIILAQTISVCCSKTMTFTPFKNIYSYLSKIDTLGKQSLFETEINNISDYLTRIQHNECSFIVIDEIMSGTNIEESSKIGKAIGKKLNSFKNNISLITTHNNKLTQLEKKNYSTNYKMKIDEDYTYKLVKGVSNDFLGIKILKEKHSSFFN
jgi:DNA mismatch repair ATPase MutS